MVQIRDSQIEFFKADADTHYFDISLMNHQYVLPILLGWFLKLFLFLSSIYIIKNYILQQISKKE